MPSDTLFDDRPTAIDLGAANLFSRRELDIFLPLIERAAQKMSSSLSATLRYNVAVKASDLRQSTFPAWWKEVHPQACLYPFGSDPVPACALLMMSPQVSFGLLELILGGEPRMEPPSRALTDVEHTLLADLARMMKREWEAAWASYTPISFPRELHEMTEQQLENTFSGDNLLISVLSARIGAASGDVAFVLSAGMLREAKRLDDANRRISHKEKDEHMESAILQRIGNCSVMLDVRMKGIKDRLSTLKQLRPGDVIRLDLPLDSTVEARVNGVVKFQGEIVAVGRRRSLLIREALVAELLETRPVQPLLR